MSKSIVVNVSAPRAGWKPLVLLPIVSGLLLWASFRSVWLSWLVWIALVPLGLQIRLQGDRRWLYLGAFLGGLACFLPGIRWLAYCDDSAWLGWLLLSLYLALYFPAFVLLARVWNRRWQMPLLFTMPIVWTALEYFRLNFCSGFGWLMLAHAVYRWTTVIQIADVGGVYLVSFLVALLNAMLVELLTLPAVVRISAGRHFNPALRWRMQLTAVLVAAATIYGWLRLRSEHFRDGPSILLVQTSLPQNLKNNDSEKTLAEVLAATLPAVAKQADLVIWPETSYPYMYGNIVGELEDLELDRLRLGRRLQSSDTPKADVGMMIRKNLAAGALELTNITDQLNKNLLVGTIRYEYALGRAVQYNASVLFAPKRGQVAYYDKIHLVPFGEFLPLQHSVPFLRALMPYAADVDFGLDAAEKYQSIHYGDLHFASLICFEDTIPDIARGMLRAADGQPVDFFVNQSNDGWFDGGERGWFCDATADSSWPRRLAGWALCRRGSSEPWDHLAAAVFRCVECRKPMARVTNLGVSSLIDGSGRVIQQTADPRARDLLRVVVPLDDRGSLYVVLGDWFAIGCALIVLLGIGRSTVRIAILIRNRLQRSPKT